MVIPNEKNLMPTMDRRSGQERRTTERYKLTIDVEWEGASGRRAATLSDVSVEGCYILGTGEVLDGEVVRIFFPLTDGTKVQLFGEVRNHVVEIGFALRFMDLSESQKDFLESFVAMHRQS